MVEQIYKQLFKDEEDRYLFANDEDTRYVVDQQSYILIYMLELLQKLLEKEEEKEILNNESKESEDETLERLEKHEREDEEEHKKIKYNANRQIEVESHLRKEGDKKNAVPS